MLLGLPGLSRQALARFARHHPGQTGRRFPGAASFQPGEGVTKRVKNQMQQFDLRESCPTQLHKYIYINQFTFPQRNIEVKHDPFWNRQLM